MPSYLNARIRWNGDKIKINASKATEESIFALGEYAVERAREYCHKKTGFLSGSIQAKSKSRSTDTNFTGKWSALGFEDSEWGEQTYESKAPEIKAPTSDRTVFVGSSASYAMAVEFGFPRRVINIKNKKALYSAEEDRFFGKRVEQTVKAYPFLRPAMDDAKKMASTILKAKFEESFYQGLGPTGESIYE